MPPSDGCIGDVWELTQTLPTPNRREADKEKKKRQRVETQNREKQKEKEGHNLALNGSKTSVKRQEPT